MGYGLYSYFPFGKMRFRTLGPKLKTFCQLMYLIFCHILLDFFSPLLQILVMQVFLKVYFEKSEWSPELQSFSIRCRSSHS